MSRARWFLLALPLAGGVLAGCGTREARYVSPQDNDAPYVAVRRGAYSEDHPRLADAKYVRVSACRYVRKDRNTGAFADKDSMDCTVRFEVYPDDRRRVCIATYRTNSRGAYARLAPQFDEDLDCKSKKDAGAGGQ